MIVVEGLEVSMASTHDVPVTAFLSCDNPKRLCTLPDVPWETKLSPAENHLLGVNTNSNQLYTFHRTGAS